MARRPSLKQLIDRGVLAVGEELTCVPRKGTSVQTATLDADGRIRSGDKTYDTPNAWAVALAGGKPRHAWQYIRRKADGLRLDEILAAAEGGTDQGRREGAVARPIEDDPSDPPITRSASSAPQGGVGVSELLERIRQLSPKQFEELVGEFLRAKGFEDVTVTGRPNDGGIDGHCTMSFVGVTVGFQAKRQQHNVRVEEVQRLVGSINERYDRGVFVTTGGYSPSARNWMEEATRPIVILDGEQFAQQLIDLELGVQHVPVVERVIDESFFSGLPDA